MNQERKDAITVWRKEKGISEAVGDNPERQTRVTARTAAKLAA
jgi:hypothetical protein